MFISHSPMTPLTVPESYIKSTYPGWTPVAKQGSQHKRISCTRHIPACSVFGGNCTWVPLSGSHFSLLDLPLLASSALASSYFFFLAASFLVLIFSCAIF
jgi:hypothetical protein